MDAITREADMGTGESEEARRRRAARLRERIEEVVGGGQAGPARRDAPRVRPPSPRDFVHQRMRELDRKPGDKED
jgi:hypothetical protein